MLDKENEKRPLSSEPPVPLLPLPLLQVCIVGSGNWGSAIARLVGYNAARLPERFQSEVVDSLQGT